MVEGFGWGEMFMLLVAAVLIFAGRVNWSSKRVKAPLGAMKVIASAVGLYAIALIIIIEAVSSISVDLAFLPFVGVGGLL